jgi:hypothetical protein
LLQVKTLQVKTGKQLAAMPKFGFRQPGLCVIPVAKQFALTQ